MSLLRLERLGKRYGARWVLEEVDLELDAGEFVFLVGPNGSGKTTLLRLLSTYAKPTRGRIVWEASDSFESLEPAEIRRGIGVVAHEPLLYDELTAEENLEFVLRIHNVANAKTRREHWLETFGFDARKKERVSTYSRGWKQRLALARAFSVEPRLLLLDEPASHLDEEGRKCLRRQLEALRGRTAVVLATHAPSDFDGLATRRLQVGNGTIEGVRLSQ